MNMIQKMDIEDAPVTPTYQGNTLWRPRLEQILRIKLIHKHGGSKNTRQKKKWRHAHHSTTRSRECRKKNVCRGCKATTWRCHRESNHCATTPQTWSTYIQIMQQARLPIDQLLHEIWSTIIKISRLTLKIIYPVPNYMMNEKENFLSRPKGEKRGPLPVARDRWNAQNKALGDQMITDVLTLTLNR